MIELCDIAKTYHTAAGQVEAVKEINLRIEDGDIFGIIGLSGAGKSTLVRCINFLEVPTSGRVLFNGVDIGSLTKKELYKVRQSIGMIFQEFNLLSQRTALQNICYPLEIQKIPTVKAKERARELLALVGLSDKENAYPSQLSGGQKQRIAIARALATNPQVLLCDECTSALDPTTTQQILSLLKEINQSLGVTIIVITHEMKVIEQICTHVAVLDKSRVAESGTVQEVFLNPRSDIAKQLIYPKGDADETHFAERCIRITFDGDSAFEPVVSKLALECHTAVNILFANTKCLNGKAFGQMVLQLPEDEASVSKIYRYLENIKIPFEEVDYRVYARND